jgi:hypothetical protein
VRLFDSSRRLVRRSTVRLVARFALLLSAALLLAAATAFWMNPGAPRQTTVREITADPVAFDGQLVTFNVGAFENGPDEKTLTYRRIANRPPLVIVEFSVPYPDRRPVAVIGKVRARTPIRITECRPVP